jgi:hypothetical protein
VSSGAQTDRQRQRQREREQRRRSSTKTKATDGTYVDKLDGVEEEHGADDGQDDARKLSAAGAPTVLARGLPRALAVAAGAPAGAECEESGTTARRGRRCNVVIVVERVRVLPREAVEALLFVGVGINVGIDVGVDVGIGVGAEITSGASKQRGAFAFALEREVRVARKDGRGQWFRFGAEHGWCGLVCAWVWVWVWVWVWPVIGLSGMGWDGDGVWVKSSVCSILSHVMLLLRPRQRRRWPRQRSASFGTSGHASSRSEEMLDAAYCGLEWVARKGKWQVGMQLGLGRRRATTYLLYWLFLLAGQRARHRSPSSPLPVHGVDGPCF